MAHEPMVLAMKRMAMFRQAEVSAQTYVAYALALAEHGIAVDVVEAACRRFEVTERAEGETAFPSLATMLRYCHEVTYRRMRQRNRALAEEGRLLEERNRASYPDFTPEESKAFMAEFKSRVEAQRRGLALVKKGDAA